MARSISIPSTLYQADTVWQFQVDNFPGNVNELRGTISRESWPGTNEDIVLSLSLKWNDGSGLGTGFSGGVLIGRDGQVVTEHRFNVQVPRIGQGKKNVVGGTLTLTFHQALTTAIVLEARA